MAEGFTRVGEVAPYLDSLRVPDRLAEEFGKQRQFFQQAAELLSGELTIPCQGPFCRELYKHAAPPLFTFVNTPIKTTYGIPKKDYYPWLQYWDMLIKSPTPEYAVNISIEQFLEVLITQHGWGVVFSHLVYVMFVARTLHGFPTKESQADIKKHMMFVLHAMKKEYSQEWIVY